MTQTAYCVVQAFLVDSGDHTALSAVRSVEFVGNRTECALLLMLRGWGHDYKGIRDAHKSSVKKVYTFSSATKMASVLVQMSEDSYRLYVKVRSRHYWHDINHRYSILFMIIVMTIIVMTPSIDDPLTGVKMMMMTIGIII